MPADETGVTQIGDLTERGRRRLVVFAVLRTVATVALVLVLYFLLPLGGGTSIEKIAKLTLGALVLTAIIIWQVRQIVRSNHPVGRAVEAMAFSVPRLHVALRNDVLCDGSHESGTRSAFLSAEPTQCISLPPCSPPSALVTSRPRAKPLASWLPCRCGSIWRSWVSCCVWSPRPSNTASSTVPHDSSTSSIVNHRMTTSAPGLEQPSRPWTTR